MSLSDLYVAPELSDFARRIGVSAVNLTRALVEGDLSHLDHDELAKLRASCTAPAPRKPDPLRLLTTV